MNDIERQETTSDGVQYPEPVDTDGMSGHKDFLLDAIEREQREAEEAEMADSGTQTFISASAERRMRAMPAAGSTGEWEAKVIEDALQGIGSFQEPGFYSGDGGTFYSVWDERAEDSIESMQGIDLAENLPGYDPDLPPEAPAQVAIVHDAANRGLESFFHDGDTDRINRAEVAFSVHYGINARDKGVIIATLPVMDDDEDDVVDDQSAVWPYEFVDAPSQSRRARFATGPGEPDAGKSGDDEEAGGAQAVRFASDEMDVLAETTLLFKRAGQAPRTDEDDETADVREAPVTVLDGPEEDDDEPSATTVVIGARRHDADLDAEDDGASEDVPAGLSVGIPVRVDADEDAGPGPGPEDAPPGLPTVDDADDPEEAPAEEMPDDVGYGTRYSWGDVYSLDKADRVDGSDKPAREVDDGEVPEPSDFVKGLLAREHVGGFEDFRVERDELHEALEKVKGFIDDISTREFEAIGIEEVVEVERLRNASHAEASKGLGADASSDPAADAPDDDQQVPSRRPQRRKAPQGQVGHAPTVSTIRTSMSAFMRRYTNSKAKEGAKDKDVGKRAESRSSTARHQASQRKMMPFGVSLPHFGRRKDEPEPGSWSQADEAFSPVAGETIEMPAVDAGAVPVTAGDVSEPPAATVEMSSVGSDETTELEPVRQTAEASPTDPQPRDGDLDAGATTRMAPVGPTRPVGIGRDAGGDPESTMVMPAVSVSPDAGGRTVFEDKRTAEQVREDEHFMQLAIEQACRARDVGEVPIGAVVVCDGQVVATGFNRRETDHDPSAHAEAMAMQEASRNLGRWRLTGCTVYVTLEPCLMCAGLMQQSRIDRCVYGAHDAKGGALGSLYNVAEDARLNHTFEVTPSVCEQECAKLLRDFFAMLRSRNKGRKGSQR